MVMVDVGSAKTAQEIFRLIQHAAVSGKIVGVHNQEGYRNTPMQLTVASILRQLEVHRPHYVDGKHGNLHTRTCGCSADARGLSEGAYVDEYGRPVSLEFQLGVPADYSVVKGVVIGGDIRWIDNL